MSTPYGPIYDFDGFSLDAAERVLRRQTGCVTLNPKGCEVLLWFLTHPGEVISREGLKTEIWRAAVSDNSVDQKLTELRDAFAAVGAPSPIRNRRGKGWYLVAAVSVRDPSQLPPPA